MGSCAAPSAKGDDKFITTDYLQQCLKENRLMRIHVLSAFFARTGPGAPGEPIPQKPVSLFKVAVDTAKKPRNSGRPKEVNNR